MCFGMLRRGAAAIFAATATLGLAGCIGGGSSPATSSGASGGNSMRLAIFGNPEQIPPDHNPYAETNYTCPVVDIIEGAAAFRIGSASGVAQQAGITDVARECSYAERVLSMKVGVQGRLLLGAGGKSGTFTVPVRIALKRGDTVVSTKFTRVQVTVPSGETSVAFTHVETGLTAPITEADPGEEYEVYVGFDAKGGPADPRSGRRTRR